MPKVPTALSDLGLTAVALFFIVAAIYLVLRIIQAVRSKPSEGNGNGNGRRPGYCIQSPELATIRTNQALTLEAVRKIEEGGEEIKQNMVLQTKLLEQFAHILEKLSDCMVRQEATEKARDRMDETRLLRTKP